jgi:predicted Rossmann-fold nucleotide-binding protein
MTKLHGRVIEIDSLGEFDELVSQGARSMGGWRLQGLDLTRRAEQLRRLDPCGGLLLGCRLDPETKAHLVEGGALLFPDIPEMPFDPYRTRLYRPEELFDGIQDSPYSTTLDARMYAWSKQVETDVQMTLARALHDHAVDVALREHLRDRRAVGVMGGHALQRGTRGYADAARLGRDLTRARLYVVTGGGPGAMEAANLGAYLANADDDALEQALAMLAEVPGFEPSITRWACAAFAVRERWPEGASSLGIPTWFYGHEPPNAFASAIAKYFQNSLREDTLLRRCDAGIVFLPGAGGTVQEVFQDACENYYADESTVAPMVLVGTEHWTSKVPAWPLLRALAGDRPMARAVHLVDSPAEATALVA